MSSIKMDELFQELNIIGKGNIQFHLWERAMGNYGAWILCCGINSSNILEDTWEDIVDCLAIYLQANLTPQIERSNIYLIFFLEQQVPNYLKMKVEYDRYCCRKIVINEKFPQSDRDREKKIEDLIFYVKEYEQIGELDTLDRWLENNEPSLLKIYKEYEKGLSIENAFNLYGDI